MSSWGMDRGRYISHTYLLEFIYILQVSHGGEELYRPLGALLSSSELTLFSVCQQDKFFDWDCLLLPARPHSIS